MQELTNKHTFKSSVFTYIYRMLHVNRLFDREFALHEYHVPDDWYVKDT